jgi:hypothetical protein
VKNLGSNAVSARPIFLCLALCFLLACSPPSGREYFCESYSQESTISRYKQQIVRLSEQDICVAWPIDTPQCAKAGEPSMTLWLQGTDATKQMRAQLQATFSAQQVSLDIVPFVRDMGDVSNGVASPTEQLQFIFRPADASLQMSSGQSEQKTISFVCKPWEKQKWWSIY